MVQTCHNSPPTCTCTHTLTIQIHVTFSCTCKCILHILVWSVCTGQYSSIGALILQEAVLLLLCLGLQRSHIDPLVELLHTALQHRSGRESLLYMYCAYIYMYIEHHNFRAAKANRLGPHVYTVQSPNYAERISNIYESTGTTLGVGWQGWEDYDCHTMIHMCTCV